MPKKRYPVTIVILNLAGVVMGRCPLLFERRRGWRFILFVLLSFTLISPLFGLDNHETEAHRLQEGGALVSRQIDLLDNRIKRAQMELATLQKQEMLERETLHPLGNMGKKLLDQSNFDLAIAKSNLDSINIELTESQQTVTQLEKEVQELHNQLNVVNIFGLHITGDGSANLEHVHSELTRREDVLTLEKIRTERLQTLQSYAMSVLQLYQTTHSRIENQRKSEAILQLKNRQTKAELDFQAQQNTWFQRLNQLENRLDHFQRTGSEETSLSYDKLRMDIFYANENVSLIYLQMLIVRYQDQIHQLSISISSDTSITLLNRAAVQMQTLTRQLALVNRLLKDRLTILAKRRDFDGISSDVAVFYQKEFTGLELQYHLEAQKVDNLTRQLTGIRSSMDRALQREISSRQGLPDFSLKTWVNLGGEILLLPSLTFQVAKSLGLALFQAAEKATLWNWLLLFVLEALWVMGALFLYDFLSKRVATLADHESGHINLKWLAIRLIQRTLVELAVFGNATCLFWLGGIAFRNYLALANLALVWLFFRYVILTARLSLIETVHDRAGQDVRLYRHLRWILVAGGLITGFAVFMNQLPVVYEVKELSVRLFLVFLFIISFYLLRQWQLVPNLILLHIDEKRTYVRRVIRVLGLLIPLIILLNSVIGLLGFVNLVQTISWYESIFILVLAVYLIIRGLLNDAMEFASKLLIRHVSNGWLWTEAFLKPLDRLLRVTLFLFSWVILFLIYGWNRQEQLYQLLHYHLLEFLKTTITPLSLLELGLIASILFWAARWTREFVYRLLLSRTRDLGVRNSLAILSQYAMIVVGFFICLSLLGINLQALTFVATAFSLGVGLGLRDLANNFVCGFLLLLERPLRIGDTISVGEYEGEVTHIGGRAVTLRTWDRIDVLVPNAEIFSKSFSNWTANDNIIRTVISIKVNRADDPHRVQKIIVDALNEHPGVLQDPAPEAFLKELADGMIEFEVRYFLNLRQVRSRPGLRSEALMAIWDAFEKHGIKAPYPHQEVVLKEDFRRA